MTSSVAVERALDEYLGWCENDQQRVDAINHIQALLAERNPIKHPVANVQWVPIDTVHPNGYNPNTVATRELQLLYTSIKADGYTQPVVTAADGTDHEIVDGFHRFFTAQRNLDIQASTCNRLPIVEISTDIGDRMEATVRHNRARGRHSVDGMANIVFRLLDEGYSENEVMLRLGMEASEIARLTHISGFSKLMKDHEYSMALASRTMILAARDQEEDLL